MSSLTIVRGTSGTGKSTRLQHLVDELTIMQEGSLGFGPETLYHTYLTKAGKEKQGMTGLYFENFNALIICRYVNKKDGRTVLESLDGLKTSDSGLIKNSDHIDAILRDHNDKNVIIEGYALAQYSIFRRRPRFILSGKGEYDYQGHSPLHKGNTYDGLGFDRMMGIHILYDNFQQAFDRITGRGGKPIHDKSPAWVSNVSYTKDAVKEKGLESTYGNKLQAESWAFDAPVEILTHKWWEFVNEDYHGFKNTEAK